MEIQPYVRRANYYETDQMGIVHHTNYIRYFEEARLDFMRQIGCSCKDLEKQGIIIPVVDAYARYIKSVEFDDEIKVLITFKKFNGVRMEFSYEIRFSETDELAVTGNTSHCFTNTEHKPIRIRNTFPEIYEKMKSFVSEN